MSVAQVIGVVASFYHVPVIDLLGPSRLLRFARPRQVAMYVARHVTGRSLPALGRTFRRDHSTVLAAIRRVEALRRADVMVDRDVLTLLGLCAATCGAEDPVTDEAHVPERGCEAWDV